MTSGEAALSRADRRPVAARRDAADVGEDDLKQALDDVLAGREVAPETTVDGCPITLPATGSAAEGAGDVLRARRAAASEALPGMPSQRRAGTVFAGHAGRRSRLTPR